MSGYALLAPRPPSPLKHFLPPFPLMSNSLQVPYRVSSMTLGFNAPAPQCLANGAQYVSFCLRFCAQVHLSLLCLTCSFSCIWVSVNSPTIHLVAQAGDLVALRGAPSPLPHIHSNSQSYPFYISRLSALLFLSISLWSSHLLLTPPPATLYTTETTFEIPNPSIFH